MLSSIQLTTTTALFYFQVILIRLHQFVFWYSKIPKLTIKISHSWQILFRTFGEFTFGHQSISPEIGNA